MAKEEVRIGTTGPFKFNDDYTFKDGKVAVGLRALSIILGAGGSGQALEDNACFQLGTANDVCLKYDGTNLSIDVNLINNSSTKYVGGWADTPVALTADDTTPDVRGIRIATIPNTWTSSHDITDFDAGGGSLLAGQRLTVQGGDSDCSVVDGSGIELVGDAAWVAAVGASLELRYDGTVWREQYRSVT